MKRFALALSMLAAPAMAQQINPQAVKAMQADMTTMASQLAGQVIADQQTIAALQAQVATLTKERDDPRPKPETPKP